VDLELDAAGWVEVDRLLDALTRHGTSITRAELDDVVRSNDKQRFAFDPAERRIRASQGHSVAVDLGYPPAQPPAELYHGTPRRNLESVRARGLVAGRRHAVHLSADVETAHVVGARRGRHVVLAVDAAAMAAAGHGFSRSDNGVWLVRAVPSQYLRVLE
jgi:putative RNA 2'-phosphotransferase